MKTLVDHERECHKKVLENNHVGDSLKHSMKLTVLDHSIYDRRRQLTRHVNEAWFGSAGVILAPSRRRRSRSHRHEQFDHGEGPHILGRPALCFKGRRAAKRVCCLYSL